MSRHQSAYTPVLGSRIARVGFHDVVELVETAVREQRREYVCFSNAHTTVTGLLDPDYREVTNRAMLAVADGMSLVWSHRLLGHASGSRVTGPSFMRKMLERSASTGHRHYLFGGTDVALKLIRQRFEGANIVGAISPPFAPLDRQDLEEQVQMINAASPDFVWVGLGAPKQELWIYRTRAALTASVVFGVGAAFDRLSGLSPEPPAWMSEAGFEWLFRLIREPKRLAKRYLLTNAVFVLGLGTQIAIAHARGDVDTRRRRTKLTG